MEMKDKVIRGLECCAAMSGDKCRECPYSKECLDADLPYGMPHLAADALALLKAQEPVEPIYNGDCDWYQCPDCRYVFDKEYNPCPNCRRAVKWE